MCFCLKSLSGGQRGISQSINKVKLRQRPPTLSLEVKPAVSEWVFVGWVMRKGTAAHTKNGSQQHCSQKFSKVNADICGSQCILHTVYTSALRIPHCYICASMCCSLSNAQPIRFTCFISQSNTFLLIAPYLAGQDVIVTNVADENCKFSDG